MDEVDIEKFLTVEERFNSTSYMFMSDLWKYDVISNQWEQAEVNGISEIVRYLYLWNGTQVYVNVETKDRLPEDSGNIKTMMQEDPETDKILGIRLPKARGGHMMTVAGNPKDYMIMFGGYGVEYLFNQEGR